MLKRFFLFFSFFFVFSGFTTLFCLNGLWQIVVSIFCFLIASIFAVGLVSIIEKENITIYEKDWEMRNKQLETIIGCNKKIEELSNLPSQIAGFINGCNVQFTQLIDKQKTFIDYTTMLLSDVENQKNEDMENLICNINQYTEDIKSDMKDFMRKNSDELDSFTNAIKTETADLKNEYHNFQKYTDTLLSQMTACSENEIEQLRQIFQDEK